MTIAFFGKAGAGKDYAAQLLIDKFEALGIKAKRYAFADKLKDVAAIIANCNRKLFDDRDFKNYYVYDKEGGGIYDIRYPMPGGDFLTIREFLQLLGTEAIQGTFGKNVWANIVTEEIAEDEFYGRVKVAVVTDVRFKHEYEALKRESCLFVKIEDPTITSKDSHRSENEWEDCEADFLIVNDWTNNNTNVDSVLQQIIEYCGYSKVLQNGTK
jgi:hypothetical protein